MASLGASTDGGAAPAAAAPVPMAEDRAESAAAAPTPTADQEMPSTRQLFGLSEDTSSGTSWKGSKYTADTKTFTKWWPAVYTAEWKLPNGMRYPYVWKLQNIHIGDGNQAREEWTWEWVETPGMPTIAEVEIMLRDHYLQQQAKKQAQARAQQQSDAQESAAP